jgi:hypothetical protein
MITSICGKINAEGITAQDIEEILEAEQDTKHKNQLCLGTLL